MTRAPTEGQRNCARLGRAGFQVYRTRGSHVFVKHPDGRATAIPTHAGETIGPGLFRSILRDVEMTLEEFSNLL